MLFPGRPRVSCPCRRASSYNSGGGARLDVGAGKKLNQAVMASHQGLCTTILDLLQSHGVALPPDNQELRASLLRMLDAPPPPPPPVSISGSPSAPLPPGPESYFMRRPSLDQRENPPSATTSAVTTPYSYFAPPTPHGPPQSWPSAPPVPTSMARQHHSTSTPIGSAIAALSVSARNWNAEFQNLLDQVFPISTFITHRLGIYTAVISHLTFALPGRSLMTRF